ncbi:glypican-4 [Galendromus occidentalis]|uniref:Glypican-4 n=1 Tax=Galendromus occidentalis TaxID=34638 RepID=A0AAJ7L521_9ACAR|nr:glypican-4 [Galendromus occidentalis]
MEKSLAQETKSAFSEALKNEFGRSKQKMGTRTMRFDEYFQRLIRKSQEDFNEMFRKTYGIQYEQNTDLFRGMFHQLETFYTQGGIDLGEKMDDFFVELYQRMFQVLNSQYTITGSYLSCVKGTMKEIQPFKEVPDKLNQQITRSFYATRVFVQALGVGKDILAALQDHLEPSSACVQAMSKMHVCPQCNGFPDVKPCPAYCEAIVGDCLQDVSKVNVLWTKFIDTMLNLASRMEKQFNIEEVVEPIDLKISEAIMNFQESHEDSMEKIYKKCGHPEFRTNKPSMSNSGFSSHRRDRRSAMGNTWASNSSSRVTRKNSAAAPHGRRSDSGRGKKKDNNGLERHIESAKKQLTAMKSFFTNLPQRICNPEKSEMSPDNADAECWNGSEKTRVGSANVTDVRLRASKPGKAQRMLIRRQVAMLDIIIKKLQQAYDGKSGESSAHDDDGGSDSQPRLDGSGDFEGSGSISSGDKEAPIDPDAEGGDDDEERMPPAHLPPSTSTTQVPSVQEDLYFTTQPPSPAVPASSTKVPSSSARPGGRRRNRTKAKKPKPGTVAEASSSQGLRCVSFWLSLLTILVARFTIDPL